jgi:hypothetical protein
MQNINENPNASASEESEAISKLYSPEEFQKLLLLAFDCYFNRISSIKAGSPKLASAEADQPKTIANQPVASGGFWAAAGNFALATGALVVATASSTYEFAKKATKKKALIEFVTSEMQGIMAQRATSLTKMTNLLILFYGLRSYLQDETHSTTLSKLMEEVDTYLWKMIPYIPKTEILHLAMEKIKLSHEAVFAGNTLVEEHHVEPGVKKHHLAFLTTQILQSSPNGDNMVQTDRILFILTFANQISRAHTLLSNNKGWSSSMNPFASSYDDINAQGISQDKISEMLPWLYRCNPDDNMTTWTPNQIPFDYPRMPVLVEVAPGITMPITRSYDLKDFLYQNVPRPYMGNIYGQFLANLDKNFAQAPAQLDEFHEQEQSFLNSNN